MVELIIRVQKSCKIERTIEDYSFNAFREKQENASYLCKEFMLVRKSLHYVVVMLSNFEGGLINLGKLCQPNAYYC